MRNSDCCYNIDHLQMGTYLKVSLYHYYMVLSSGVHLGGCWSGLVKSSVGMCAQPNVLRLIDLRVAQGSPLYMILLGREGHHIG